MFVAPRVTAKHSAMVLKIFAGHKPDTNFENPTDTDVWRTPLSKDEAVRMLDCNPRTARRTFSDLLDRDLIMSAGTSMTNTPRGRTEVRRFVINSQMMPEILHYLAIDTSSSRQETKSS